MRPAYNAEHRIGPIKDIFAMKGKGVKFYYFFSQNHTYPKFNYITLPLGDQVEHVILQFEVKR